MLPKLNHSDLTLTDVRNAVNAGKVITIHASEIVFNGWTGAGYTILDKASGAGAYMISGGLNGGVTNFLFGFGLGGVLGIIGILGATVATGVFLPFVAIALIALVLVASTLALIVALIDFESGTGFEADCFLNGILVGISTVLTIALLGFPVALVVSIFAAYGIPISLLPNLRSNSEYLYG